MERVRCFVVRLMERRSSGELGSDGARQLMA
jgi:hypothetical protein